MSQAWAVPLFPQASPGVHVLGVISIDSSFFPQASLGGHVRMIVTGAAPASPTVLGFLRAALGCQVSSPRAFLGGGAVTALILSAIQGKIPGAQAFHSVGKKKKKIP